MVSDLFLLTKLNEQELPGVEFKEVKYRPSGSIYHTKVPKFDGQSCSGIRIMIKDKNKYEPVVTATTMMLYIPATSPREFQWEKDGYVDKLFGSNELRIIAAQNKPPGHLPAIWARDVYKFSEFRQPFLFILDEISYFSFHYPIFYKWTDFTNSSLAMYFVFL